MSIGGKMFKFDGPRQLDCLVDNDAGIVRLSMSSASIEMTFSEALQLRDWLAETLKQVEEKAHE